MKKIYQFQPDGYKCPAIDDFKTGDVLIHDTDCMSILMYREGEKAILLVTLDEVGQQLAEVQCGGFPHTCHVKRRANEAESKMFKEIVHADDYYIDIKKMSIKKKRP